MTPGYDRTTRFTANGEARMEGLIPEAYAPCAQSVFAAFIDAIRMPAKARKSR